MEDLLGAVEQEPLSFEERGHVYEMLRKVLSNIVDNPSEQKYRNLKKDSKLVEERICRSPAAASLLLALGFEEDGALYRCPPDVDLATFSEVVDLIDCILASRGEVTPSPSPAAAAASPAAAAAPSPGAAARSPAAASPTKAAANGGTFGRRTDAAERQREDQAGQLEAIRAAQREQFGAAAAQPAARPAAAAAPSPAAEASPKDAAADARKKPIKSAFDFENRAAKEQQAQKAVNTLEELRRQQREKYKDFQSDPSAKQSEAYQRPASIAAGGKADQSWGDWLGGLFGGSSSGGSGGGGGGGGRPPPPDERRGPRVKGIGDLPKPVQRG